MSNKMSLNKLKAKVMAAHYEVEKNQPRDKTKRRISRQIRSTGYELQKLHRGVAHFTKDGDHLITVKGTDPTNTKDLLSDVKLGLGSSAGDSQFKEREKQIERMVKGLDGRVELVGHSLGGSIVTAAMANNKVIRDKVTHATTFNPGYTKLFHRELTKDMPKAVRRELNEKITHVRTKGDVISEQVKGGSVGSVETVEDSGHSITNFLD